MSDSFGSIDGISGIQSSKDEKKNNDSNSISIDEDFELFASKSSSNNSDNEKEETTKTDNKSNSSVLSKSSKSNSSKKSASSTQKSNSSKMSNHSSRKSDTNKNDESAAELSLVGTNTNSKLSNKTDTGLSGSFLDSTNQQSTIKSSSSKSKISTKKDNKSETNKSAILDISISSKQTTGPLKSEISQVQGSTLLTNASQLSSKQQSQLKSDTKSSNNSKISTKSDNDNAPKSQNQEDNSKLQQFVRQQRKPWYDEENQKSTQNNNNSDKDAEIERLTNIVREQRTVIENQKETIRLLMNEAVSHEEISSLRAALASKSPLLQLVAATPMSEQRATKQLRAENAALRREIDEMEMRHLNELKAMRAQFALLSSRPMPTDGCAQCKRRIRELESQLKLYQNENGQ